MSAAAKQMDALEEKGMVVSGTRANLLENRIVLIVPSGSELGLSSFADIVKADAIALGDPASVPAGQYAKEALTFLGIWEEIQGRASFGTNVTEVLIKRKAAVTVAAEIKPKKADPTAQARLMESLQPVTFSSPQSTYSPCRRRS